MSRSSIGSEGLLNVFRIVIAVWASIMPAGESRGPGLACLHRPVRGPVVVFFRPPACQYCSGQRGIEFALGASTTVEAAADGIVTFSGVVVGTRYVVLEHLGGLMTTYGMLSDSRLIRGDSVRSGELVGHASRRFYFGLRLAGSYLDPLPLLQADNFRYRLIALDGTPARPAQKGSSTCARVAPTASVPR